ncbi:hypothetical protein [Actinoplanes sp. NBRC 103695]|uniref:hypothetical protein n=1 Tax=Actinoplanes sp. NBRC 103695 TaxID=3032202 RepID=UPI0024A03BE3|nr:hypothetical protein [Actinoplanes sp. NBRC 103695]GLY95562.1 hypothetical protein Acsp02_28170 [Actinoplanes sp. NBRC 103695]
MMDLRDAFEDVAGRPVAPTIQQADTDLSRGRTALRRRRAIQTAGGSLFTVAAAVAAFAVATSGTATGPGGTEAQAPPAASAKSIQLVAYKGEQPKGFTVDTVPDGWFVQAVNEYALVIAPDKAKNPGPGVDPSKAPIYDPGDYSNKIAVFLESKDAGTPQGEKIKVGDGDGILRKSLRGDVSDANGKPSPEPARADGDYGSTIFVKQPKNVYLAVQFWGGLGFSKQQMTELAAGVHVHKAVQGVG